MKDVYEIAYGFNPTVSDAPAALAITAPENVTIKCDSQLPSPDIATVTIEGGYGDITVEWVSDVSEGQQCQTNDNTYLPSRGCVRTKSNL